MDIFLALNAAVCGVMISGFAYSAYEDEDPGIALGLIAVFTALAFFSIYYI
jgi:hypothetical protein